MWQDYIFAFGGLILGLSMIPMLLDKQKPPVKTALMMVAVLLSYAIAEWTLALYGASIVTFLQIAAWVTLGVQRKRQHEPSPAPGQSLVINPADFIYRSFLQRGDHLLGAEHIDRMAAERESYLRAHGV